jgi:hypothetical protein
MARPRSNVVEYAAPTKVERADGDVVDCDGCNRTWPARLANRRLKKCANCARGWWRATQAAKRAGAEERPQLRRPVVATPPSEDVDAFLASLTVPPEPVRRPREREEKHDPNESIDSIVGRMGTEVIDMPLLPAPRKR